MHLHICFNSDIILFFTIELKGKILVKIADSIDSALALRGEEIYREEKHKLRNVSDRVKIKLNMLTTK